jgi:hypothetical protein
MSETPHWPKYPIGPRDSIFAMGVASVKYAELESILTFMFKTIFYIEINPGNMIASKIGAEACADLIVQELENLPWPENIKELVNHFIKGFRICQLNRNHLMHSDLAWIAIPKTILFKRTKQGSTHTAAPTIEELRQVADDMHVYSEFGRALANHINNSTCDPPPFPASAFPLPDRPAPPQSMSYSPIPPA